MGAHFRLKKAGSFNLDLNVVREIIWELFEHNFPVELQALDMAAAPSEWHDARLRQDVVRRSLVAMGSSLLERCTSQFERGPPSKSIHAGCQV